MFASRRHRRAGAPPELASTHDTVNVSLPIGEVAKARGRVGTQSVPAGGILCFVPQGGNSTDFSVLLDGNVTGNSLVPHVVTGEDTAPVFAGISTTDVHPGLNKGARSSLVSAQTTGIAFLPTECACIAGDIMVVAPPMLDRGGPDGASKRKDRALFAGRGATALGGGNGRDEFRITPVYKANYLVDNKNFKAPLVNVNKLLGSIVGKAMAPARDGGTVQVLLTC